MKARILTVAAILAVAISQLRAGTITVTTITDNGPGSLRDALASAADGDTIDASSLTGTILVTSGSLLVTNSVNIVGSGPSNLAVDGNGSVRRVFHVNSNAVVSMSGLTVTNGGGILNEHAMLTISNCTVSGNYVSSGGGIHNGGSDGNASVEVIDSVVSGNGGYNGGGGVLNLAVDGVANVEIYNPIFPG
jgi:hypothetical protein